MRYLDWHPACSIAPPVYLDANVLVGSKVSNHPLYVPCARIIADMLVSNACILVSALSLDEAMWATAKLAYLKLNNQPSDAAWSKRIYQKWCDKIFGTYGPWLTAYQQMLVDWRNAGAKIELVPSTFTELQSMLQLAAQYMSQFRLTPADAFHLALAEGRANTFVTADSDFATLVGYQSAATLTVMHVPRP